MAATAFNAIKDGLVRLFKVLYPTFDVFCEEISGTQGEEQPAGLEDSIFLDIIPASNDTSSAYHTQRSILVDAAIHTKSESNSDYLRILSEVDNTIRPAFRFQDGEEFRAVTVPNVAFTVVDKVLHCAFTLTFTDSVEELPPLPLMEELSLRYSK